mmetsp:Transcript_10223/g.30194  ORF Transcript_10223/g.30194 Transcript_10223/m.30194 type:complete len:354 (-) Transcript_10223:1424-2485(-)
MFKVDAHFPAEGLGALVHDPRAVASGDALLRPVEFRVGVEPLALLEDDGGVVEFQKGFVVLAWLVDDAELERAARELDLGDHRGALAPVLDRVGDGVAVDVVEEARVHVNDGQRGRHGAHLEARVRPEVALEEGLEVHRLVLRGVVAVGEVLGDRLGEHRVERLLKLGAEVREALLEGEGLHGRARARAGTRTVGGGPRLAHVVLAEEVALGDGGEHRVLHLVPGEAVRLLVLLPRHLLRDHGLFGDFREELLLCAVELHPRGDVAHHEDEVGRAVPRGVAARDLHLAEHVPAGVPHARAGPVAAAWACKLPAEGASVDTWLLLERAPRARHQALHGLVSRGGTARVAVDGHR